MWESTGRFVLKFRFILLLLLLAASLFMGWYATKVQLSYEFSRAIPTDNPKYQTYQTFRNRFGEDGNLLMAGLQTDRFFTASIFNEYALLIEDIRKIEKVEEILCIPTAVQLAKNESTEKLAPQLIFSKFPMSQSDLDSSAAVFRNLPFYRGLLYNPDSSTYLLGIKINKQTLASADRTRVVTAIVQRCETFNKKTGMQLHYSGLPLIRTSVANMVASEMKWFLIGSLVLSAVILLLFFRSVTATLLSLTVVMLGVIWSVGTIVLLGYKITLLTALIPPLIVVIGIPNCIYFLNKYHISYNETGDKNKALVKMISKMGVVTLFCNIAAAIGFAVFALTKSPVLQEFGEVAGINIMVIFLISFILIPAVLSYLPTPKKRHTRYLDNKWLLSVLDKLEIWALDHRKLIYWSTGIVVAMAITGILRLKSEGFILDDLPKTDKIYTDLKFFERNFKGVMPLEILVDTRKKNGLRSNPLKTFESIDSLSSYIASRPDMARPLSIVEGLKFARQAYYDGDSTNYGLPNSFDISFLAAYLNTKADSSTRQNSFTRLVNSFMDSTKRYARVSINMADVGSRRLPGILDTLQRKANQYFDTSKYTVQLTGSSVSFLEGSSFIINGLKESILWAFLLISLCMLYLFRSFRILICSLIPNLIPLIITAGVMGWTGVPLKPSTVLVFSVALGIAIDITIRFLVNYKQELQGKNLPVKQVVIDTIHSTGISIIYTSLVLTAGFIIFCFSGFGGTQALGWLTSLTLIVATLTNLILLPALLIDIIRKKKTALPE
ncbi:MAG: MMPL family transporter [Chitinophagaceae bacterium]|nr:MMPL family transporter [Chitinophagaceae bacterium]